MILLDTNYLIRMLVKGSDAAGHGARWIGGREQLCTSAVCWYEFVSGPVDDQGVALVTSALTDRIIPFTGDQAREAARLYNGAGRVFVVSSAAARHEKLLVGSPFRKDPGKLHRKIGKAGR